MQVGTMSFSEHHYQEYGELFEYDEDEDEDDVSNGNGCTGTSTTTTSSSSIVSGSGSGSGSGSPARATAKLATPSPASDRPSWRRYSSELSMDLSELQDVLGGEEDTNNRFALGSMFTNSNIDNGLSESSLSPWQQHQHQHQHHYLGSVQEYSDAESDSDSDNDNDNNNDGAEYSHRDNNTPCVNSSELKFDERSEDCLQQNNNDDYSSFYSSSSFAAAEHRQEQHHQQHHQQQQQQQQSLSTLHEQGESESESSMSTSSLSSPALSVSALSVSASASASTASSRLSDRSLNENINNRRRKVKFEISTRLEDIQEFEKPDFEDYHMLYYTSHELQKMIDGRRVEEQRERNVVR